MDVLGLSGRRMLVVGGASGIGAAAVELASRAGAGVVVMDRAPVAADVDVVTADLRQRASIEAALARVGAPIHALLGVAGVAEGTPGMMTVNLIAHRHIVEQVVSRGWMPPGSAISMVSSVASLGWEQRVPLLRELLDVAGFEEAEQWVQQRPELDTYRFGKQALSCYVARRSLSLLRDGIRINAVCPGPTDTPLARANAPTWLGFAADYREATGTSYLTPAEIANVVVFLASPAASGVTGVSVLADRGHVMSSVAGSWAPGADMIEERLRPTERTGSET